MIKIITGSILLSMSFIACNNTTAHNEPQVNPDSLKAATISVPTPAALPQTALQQPQNIRPIVPANATPASPAQVVTQAVPAAAAPIAKGMNPPHGQPNHRCDIAVGAPLSTPIQAMPAANQTVGQPTAVQTVTPTKTAKGMNPPHGEPNHRCDIAVGAPLNSPVAKPTPAPTVTPVAIPTPATTEVVKDSTGS